MLRDPSVYLYLKYTLTIIEWDGSVKWSFYALKIKRYENGATAADFHAGNPTNIIWFSLRFNLLRFRQQTREQRAKQQNQCVYFYSSIRFCGGFCCIKIWEVDSSETIMWLQWWGFFGFDIIHFITQLYNEHTKRHVVCGYDK